MEPTDYKNIEDLLKSLQKNSTSLNNSQITLDSLMDEIRKHIEQVQYQIDDKKDESILTINNIDKFLNNPIDFVILKDWKVDASSYVFEVSIVGCSGPKNITLSRTPNEYYKKYWLNCEENSTGKWIDKDILKNPHKFFREIRYVAEDLPF